MKSLTKIKSLLSTGLLALATLAMVQINTTSWTIDKTHSAINFTVTHFFTPVNGSFENYEATIKFDPNNLSESMIDVKIDVASINTKNEKRDNHLQSPDFFNAEKWPHIKFKSTHIESKGNNKYVAHGTLTIKDVSKEVELPFTLLGIQENPMQQGKKVAGITSSIKLDRTTYGVGVGDWASDAVVGDEVSVNLNIEMNAEKTSS